MWQLRCDFPSSQNSLMFAMSTLFCVKKCPCENPLSPTPSLFVSKPRISILESKNTVRVWRGGGVDFQEWVWNFVFPFVKKKTKQKTTHTKPNTRTFFHRKSSAWEISTTWNMETKFLHRAGWHGPFQLWNKNIRKRRAHVYWKKESQRPQWMMLVLQQ